MVARLALEKPPVMLIDETAIRWMQKIARQEHWRVERWMGLSDLLQEGYFTWYRIVNGKMRNGGRQDGGVSLMHQYRYVRERPVIMRLFQNTFKQHITDLANKRTDEKDFNEELPETAEASTTDNVFDFAVEEERSLKSVAGDAAEDAPWVVKRVLQFYKKHGTDVIHKRKGETHSAFNARLGDLLNIDGDICGLVEQHLTKDRSPRLFRLYRIERARSLRRVVAEDKGFRVVYARNPNPFPSYDTWCNDLCKPRRLTRSKA